MSLKRQSNAESDHVYLANSHNSGLIAQLISQFSSTINIRLGPVVIRIIWH